MRYYDFLNPSVNFMGPNCVELLGERCQILGMNKPMIVTDGFLASMENGPVAQSVASLEKAGIEYVIFTSRTKSKDSELLFRFGDVQSRRM